MNRREMPTTYQELDAFLGTRDAKALCNNTYAERLGAGVIGVRLHSTHVVILSPVRIVLNTGGWSTITTKDRLNRFLPGGWGVTQKNHEWFLDLHVCSNGEGSARVVHESFYDGITIDLSLGSRGEVIAREEVTR